MKSESKNLMKSSKKEELKYHMKSKFLMKSQFKFLIQLMSTKMLKSQYLTLLEKKKELKFHTQLLSIEMSLFLLMLKFLMMLSNQLKFLITLMSHTIPNKTFQFKFKYLITLN